ncbi:serine hydrolase [Aquimarina sp. 2201CG1-2-11]|uniref:serine hydrolase n=1 Tax=Aquimarina discodermiae TaxID=3231043 RepID=UPI003463201E
MKIKSYIFNLLFLLSPVFFYGQVAAINAAVEDEIIKQDIPGVAIGVIKDGKLYYARGYGYKDKDKQIAVSSFTSMRWASISKPLTAVATLKLAETYNSFDLNDKVTEHIDYWTASNINWKSKIRIRHLLSNRSGINHYGGGTEKDENGNVIKKYNNKSSNTYVSDADDFNAESAVNIFKGPNLDFYPGTKYLYSSYGFNLLGAVVDEVSPNGYPAWVKKHIADKLGMTSLKIGTGSFTGVQKACDGVMNNKTIGNVEWKLPSGGWQSNVRDLTKFAIGIMNETLLNDTSVLWTDVPGNGSYGYGIGHNGDEASDFFRLSHNGAHDNVRTDMHFYPNKGIGVVVMIPVNYGDASRIRKRVYTAIGHNWASDTTPKDACTSTMKSCEGKFAGVWRKTNKDVIVRRGYSHSNFAKEWQKLRAKGYYCDDFEPSFKSGKLVWDGVFKKGLGGNPMWRGYDQAGFNTKWKEMSNMGYRLIDLETYVINGQRKWAGLFRPGNGAYALIRNYSTAGFAQKRAEFASKGMKLIDIEVYTSGGQQKWSGVWIAGQDGLLNRNYTTAGFNTLWNQHRQNGYRLIDIETYEISGNQRWAGIWEKSNQGEYLNRNHSYCSIMNNHTNYSKNGYELIDIERYGTNIAAKSQLIAEDSDEKEVAQSFDDAVTITPNFEVYPNPTKGKININVFNSKDAIVNIYSLTGRKLLSTTVVDKQIDLTSFAAGIYVVEVLQEGQEMRKKIILE